LPPDRSDPVLPSEHAVLELLPRTAHWVGMKLLQKGGLRAAPDLAHAELERRRVLLDLRDVALHLRVTRLDRREVENQSPRSRRRDHRTRRSVHTSLKPPERRERRPQLQPDRLLRLAFHGCALQLPNASAATA